MNDVNLIIIGIGPHAQRIYLPILHKYYQHLGLEVKLGIDIKSKQEQIKSYLTANRWDLNVLFIDPFHDKEILPTKLALYLTEFVNQNNIQGVIISAEPLVHQAYAKWALQQDLHILMDKPISTRENVVTDIEQAMGIEQDYQELRLLYDQLQTYKQTIFSINVHRRYHVGHQKVISLIKEVANKFDAPVTSIQSTHADGQWRLPNEIVDQTYHPYCQGYGKCSHSGYHFFDIVYQYYLAGRREGKYADTIQLMSSFVQPHGFISQFNEKNYANYFGDDYQEVKLRSDTELNSLFENYGEMDASILLRLMKNGNNICNASINLLHNSFARRTWIRPGNDLYKGNGRAKHEYHAIQQGPFQCIQVHSYQSNDKHDINTEEDYLLGGNNHFDIYVFRNAGMFGQNEKPLETYQLKDLDLNKRYSGEQLIHEATKEIVVLEFINFIQGKVSKDALLSNIDSHLIPIKIMSYVYQSHIQQTESNSPLVEFPMQEDNRVC